LRHEIAATRGQQHFMLPPRDGGAREAHDDGLGAYYFLAKKPPEEAITV